MIYIYKHTRIDVADCDVTIAVYEHLSYAMSANPGNWVETSEGLWEIPEEKDNYYDFQMITECMFGDRI